MPRSRAYFHHASWLVAGAAGLIVVLAALSVGCPGAVGGGDGDGDCVRLPPGCGGVDLCCDAQNICIQSVCQGIGYTCAQVDGVYTWQRGGAPPCDDGDPCTENDLCVAGGCRGLPKLCTSPPPNACGDDSTVRSYSAQGSCGEDGACAYPQTVVKCPQGCVDGKCQGEPCTGVQCDNPPGPCHKNPGTCVDGTCNYDPLPATTACTPSDPCQTGGTCDGAGTCQSSGKQCSAPNATGGSCVNGACTGFACVAGYGNCNGDWNDGCEAKLDTSSNCGQCGNTCSGAAHATSSCSGGKCVLKCTSPWQDCNGDPGDGCEIPVGVANRCDRTGLNSSTGCGTAYCGSATHSNAVNFGEWTCAFCSHCHLWSNGWSWCLSQYGTFSSDRCASCCNAGSADKVCAK